MATLTATAEAARFARLVVTKLRELTGEQWACREPDTGNTRRYLEFVDPDGRVFTILNDWNGKPRFREVMR